MGVVLKQNILVAMMKEHVVVCTRQAPTLRRGANTESEPPRARDGAAARVPPLPPVATLTFDIWREPRAICSPSFLQL